MQEEYRALNPSADGSCSGCSSSSSVSEADILPVLTAGSYQYSLASGLAELDKFDRNKFTTSDEILAYLKFHYSSDAEHSFLILKFNETSNFHPFCYLHPIKNEHNQLFIPTRHFHPSLTQSSDSLVYTDFKAEYVDDWDYEIYVIGLENPSFVGLQENHWIYPIERAGESKSRFKKLLDWNNIISRKLNCKIVANGMARIRIRGRHPNNDLMLF